MTHSHGCDDAFPQRRHRIGVNAMTHSHRCDDAFPQRRHRIGVNATTHSHKCDTAFPQRRHRIWINAITHSHRCGAALGEMTLRKCYGLSSHGKKAPCPGVIPGHGAGITLAVPAVPSSVPVQGRSHLWKHHSSCSGYPGPLQWVPLPHCRL